MGEGGAPAWSARSLAEASSWGGACCVTLMGCRFRYCLLSIVRGGAQEYFPKAVDSPFRVLIMRASSGAVLSENSLKIKELNEIKDCIGGGFS